MSKLRPAISDSVDAPRPRGNLPPLGDPRLLWPSLKYGPPIQPHDLRHFPDVDQVEHRHVAGARHENGKCGLYVRLDAFASAVEQSLKCVLVLDPFFDDIGVEAIGLALASSAAKDIRLLTGGRRGEREDWRRTLQDFRNLDRIGSNRAQVLWSTLLNKDSFPFLHDRFAVVDGALWHFGSTVGGGHHGLTAASGPWPEYETRGKRFFEECWRRLHA